MERKAMGLLNVAAIGILLWQGIPLGWQLAFGGAWAMHTDSLAFRFGLAELRWLTAALWGHVQWFHRFWFVVAMFTWLVADLLESWKPFATAGAIALYFALWARFFTSSYGPGSSPPFARS